MASTDLLRKIRIALTPRDHLLRTTLANGAVVLGRNRAGFGGRGVYVMRDEIEKELVFVDRFLGSEGVFVDVGANTGVYTLKVAKHFANRGTVIALEPFLETLVVLQKSVELNGFTNVRLRNVCAGSHTHSGELWLNRAKPNSFSLNRFDSQAKSVSTLIVSIDDLLRWEGVSRLDYLKIDAEGAEDEILSGARDSVARFRPIVQAEVTVSSVSTSLPDYVPLTTEGSPNLLFVPLEHRKLPIIKGLGWRNAVA